APPAAAAPTARAVSAPPEQSPVIVSGPLGRQLDDALQRYQAYGLSGTFLVAHGDEVVLSKGYGTCDRRRRAPCTPDTLFDVGSISKQFTATAIMRLEQEGRLRVTDELGDHVPSLPADLARVTIHQLLTHTSGLEDDVGRYPPGDREAFLARVGDHPRRHAGGSPSFSYSNAGYSLLAEVVRRASGRPYETYLADMLRRAGLERTRFVPQSEPPPDDAATTYDGAPGQLVEAQRIPWYLRGAGGIHSTSTDLLRWHRALAGDAVLGDRAQARLYETEIGDYAYGWHVRPGPHGKVVWHRGTIFGQQAMLKRYIDADLVVVYVINQRSGWLRLLRDLVDEMLDGVVRELPPLPAEGAARVRAGPYRLPSGATLSLRQDGDRYAVVASGDEAFVLMSRPGAHASWTRIDPAVPDGKRRTEQLLRALESGEPTRVQSLLPPEWPVPAADLLAMWRRTAAATGASTDRPLGWRILGALPGADDVVHVVVELEGAMTTRFVGVAWKGATLRAVGMLTPLHPTAQAVAIDDQRLAWLAKDGTLLSAAQRGDDLVLTWPGGDELVATRAAP
ncbi:MAG: beta-lactamase family protein, partial [Deltaproteobacteria bacterium]|nr:beta-lactamase family protein [Deltaproteobacteria bacterium]MBW2532173.1 beta-lactamase family protein [Deltaproteobacteria bacterium]